MIDDFVKKRGLPLYRIEQFYKAYYRDFISSYDELTTWPKSLRVELEREFPFSRLSEIKTIFSRKKDTVKVLFKRVRDGKFLETVLMRHRDGRNTVCVSSMIGCPIKCLFCATGRMGFSGNLSSDEIVDQILYFARFLKKQNQTISNIVYMGMGEPMLNLKEVMESIAVITDQSRMNMSDRRVTVSTSGVTPQLVKFIDSGFSGRIALSLHAPDQELRNRLMPGVSQYPLDEILDILNQYAKKTNKRVSYEYILIKGVNDHPAQARSLARLLGRELAHVNLIPVNPVQGTGFERPDRQAVKIFAGELARLHIPHTIRVTMGDDIDAACGQLAGKEK